MERSRRTEQDYNNYQNLLLREYEIQNLENAHFLNPNQTSINPSTFRTMPTEEANPRMFVNPYYSSPSMINSVNSHLFDDSDSLLDFSTMLDDDTSSLLSSFNGLSLKDNRTLNNQESLNNHTPIFQNNTYSMDGSEGAASFLHCINGAAPLSSRVHPYEQNLLNQRMQRIEEENYIRMHMEQQFQLGKIMNPYIDPSIESFMPHSYEFPTYLDNAGMPYFPQHFMSRSRRSNLTRPLRFASSHSTSQVPHFSKGFARRRRVSSSSDMMYPFYDSRSVHLRFSTVDEVAGKIYHLAKDQHGCRFLQRKFADGSLEDKHKIFSELVDHMVELTTDPFGNYLVQKMLEVCNENQRMQIINALTKDDGTIIEISCNMHGTRAVQKVIETLKTTEQAYKIISALKHNVVSLMNNINGNHVAQCCLKRFLHDQNDFLFDAAIQNCVQIGTNRQGCCVLQKCILHSNDDQRNSLMSQIASYSFVLAQDQFGNYLVSFLLVQRIRWVTAAVLDELKGNYAYLSMQKHSSPVVEKCLVYASEDDIAQIVRELMAYHRFLHILQDAFGNYVIQKALIQCKGNLRASLVDAIRSHAPALRHHPFGKKVLLSIGSRNYY